MNDLKRSGHNNFASIAKLIGEMIMDKDYSVTWNDIKNRVEKWLIEKRGIGGDEPIPMGTIDYAMTMV